MNVLLDTFALLANALTEDPFLSLANAVAWLDPLWQMPADYEYEEGNEADLALHIARSAFPEIYAGAIEQIRAGVTYAELNNYVCREVSNLGIPLDSIEYLGYGIPLPAHGAELNEPEFYSTHPDIVRILKLFGVQPVPDEYRVEVPDNAYKAGRLLADSLAKQEDARWQQVGWVLAWLFSSTGNSLIDCDYEELAEIPPLTWEEENIAFAIEIIEEAEGILEKVNAGLTLLASHPSAFNHLSGHVNHIYRRFADIKETKREPRIRLEWPTLGGSADGATIVGPELLQLWHDAVET